MMAGIKKGLAHHEHACTAAVNGVIHLSVAAFGKVSGIGHSHFYQSRFQSPLNHALVKECFYEFRKEG
jgi:hypothetical protein